MTGISLAMAAVTALALDNSAVDINQMDGCWEHRIDDKWWVSLNGHGHPVKNSKDTEVPPYSAYVEWLGWPAGVIDPGGGVLVAGDGANEDTFIAAIEAVLGCSVLEWHENRKQQ